MFPFKFLYIIYMIAKIKKQNQKNQKGGFYSVKKAIFKPNDYRKRCFEQSFRHVAHY